MSKKWGIIPAHLESTRLPRKLLRTIHGHPMIVWVYRRARVAPSLDGLLVATDSDEIMEVCRIYNIPVMLTAREHRSGTDRLFEVMERGPLGMGDQSPADIYVNIQGDEPMITAEHIDLLLSPFDRAQPAPVSTLKVAIGLEEARDPSNVKVVTDSGGRALYFSRALIPCDRDETRQVLYYKHMGFYSYTAAAIEKFHSSPPSPLETAEKLEQLRFLENGIPISVVETRLDTIGVDTEEDLQKVEEYFRRCGVSLPEA